jgi:phosphate transport system substrate-binding protein
MATISRLASAVLLISAGLVVLGPASAQQATAEDTKKSMAAQAERAGVILDRGEKPHYTTKFDLSGMPHYVPGKPLTGWIRLHGSNYLVDGKLGEYWQQGFAKYQPRLRISYYLPTAAIAFASLY